MLYKIAKVEKIYFLVYQVVQHFFLDPCTLLLVLISKSQKMQKKKIRVTSSRADLIFQFYILKLLVLAKRFPVISSKINTMEHYMGLQSKKNNNFFICDDIIELQMFQGCQNWSWISQGVLGLSFSRT